MIERLGLPRIHALETAMDAAAGPGHPASGLRPGTTSPGGVAVAGLDGHLFIGDGANRWERQFCGQLDVAPSWLEKWAALFARRQKEAALLGLTAVNFVAPEKQVLLADRRWPGGMESAARRPLMRLIEGVGQDALIYPDAVMAALSAAPSYFRHNSHWTPSGCIAAAELLWTQLGATTAAEGLTFAIERKTTHHDLPVHFFNDPPVEEMLILAPPGEVSGDNRMLQITGRHVGARYCLTNPAAPDRRRVMLFGDSYAYDAGLSHALAAVFAQVTFVWSKSIQWDQASGADIVVWEGAERFLTTIPEH
jgi:hypothetical protein